MANAVEAEVVSSQYATGGRGAGGGKEGLILVKGGLRAVAGRE